MKLNFEVANDGKYHEYCANCHAETLSDEKTDAGTLKACSTCGQKNERSIIIDPALKWWVDDDKELWHESCGVFIRNPQGKFLFFQRVLFPIAVTMPAGHIDAGEDPKETAVREMREEVGIDFDNPRLVAETDIPGDSCRRGCDMHKWHVFVAELDDTPDIKVNEEGEKPIWLSLDEASGMNLTFAAKYIISHFAKELGAKTN